MKRNLDPCILGQQELESSFAVKGVQGLLRTRQATEDKLTENVPSVPRLSRFIICLKKIIIPLKIPSKTLANLRDWQYPRYFPLIVGKNSWKRRTPSRR